MATRKLINGVIKGIVVILPEPKKTFANFIEKAKKIFNCNSVGLCKISVML